MSSEMPFPQRPTIPPALIALACAIAMMRSVLAAGAVRAGHVAVCAVLAVAWAACFLVILSGILLKHPCSFYKLYLITMLFLNLLLHSIC